MRTLVTLGWMSLTLAAPAGALERGYAPLNGLQLYYEIHGTPAKDGVPLVLLHGGGSTIETSAEVAAMVDEFLPHGVNARPDSRR